MSPYPLYSCTIVATKETERNTRVSRAVARGAAFSWIAADAAAGGVELHRLYRDRGIFPQGTLLEKHYGNFSETELLTFGVHIGEEIAINHLHMPAPLVRTLGFLTVVATNVLVESPMFFYHLGPHNVEFSGDVISGILGYVAAKIPLMILSYQHHARLHDHALRNGVPAGV